jgi:hypothetical protein
MRIGIVLWAALAVVAAAPAAAAPAAPTHETCAVMVPAGDKVEQREAPGLKLLGTAGRLSAPPGIKAVICDRDAIVPAEGDDRVLEQLSVPLYLREGDRVAVLEMVVGRYQLRFVAGEIAPDEATAVQTALNAFQTRQQQASGTKGR